MKSSFSGYFGAKIKLIDKALAKYISLCEDGSNPIVRPMRYSLFPGGKRIRPILCLEACLVSGGKAAWALPAACALEYIHTFSLIHDDLPSMDDDDFRRGKLSCHKKFGEAKAVLAGDALLNIAFDCVSRAGDPDVAMALVKTLSQATGSRGIIGGQALDIIYAKKRKSERLDHKINMLKTGALFEAALVSGALCAKAGPAKIKRLAEYGRLFGKAFQVRDNVLDGDYPAAVAAAKKTELKSVIKRAKTTLDIFGKKAHNLRYAADMLLLD